MDAKEFKLFYKNKSPLLFTYLLKELISSKISEEILQHIFAKYYRIKNYRPESLSKEKWLLLITKKVLIDYFNWRTTEEGQAVVDAGLSSYQCSHLAISHQSQLTLWTADLDEETLNKINEAILSELPPPDIRETVQDKVRNKLQEIGEKYGSRKK